MLKYVNFRFAGLAFPETVIPDYAGMTRLVGGNWSLRLKCSHFSHERLLSAILA
jgi:hypothetical protein